MRIWRWGSRKKTPSEVDLAEMLETIEDLRAMVALLSQNLDAIESGMSLETAKEI